VVKLFLGKSAQTWGTPGFSLIDAIKYTRLIRIEARGLRVFLAFATKKWQLPKFPSRDGFKSKHSI